MQDRIKQELQMLRQYFPLLEHIEVGNWIRVPSYPLVGGWNRTETDTVFQIPVTYPSTPPYGIYVPAGLLFNSTRPSNYVEPAGIQPPWPGSWGFFSWTADDGEWRSTGIVASSSNLMNWVKGLGDRFREGI
jgi:hypothetical protein